MFPDPTGSRSFTILTTRYFNGWYDRLRDSSAKIRIDARILRLASGNVGDVRSVGGGVWELRIHYGPGYRVYFAVQGSEVVLLLAGGDKSSQRDDIRRAHRLASDPEASED